MVSSASKVVGDGIVNTPSFISGIASMFTSDLRHSANVYLAITTLVAALFLFTALSTPRLDPREPPILKPTIPFIGHIIGMIRHQAIHHQTLLLERSDLYWHETVERYAHR
jgi:hypothetical protein